MRPCRFLCVDDEPGIRETLPLVLRAHGHEVTAVGTVAEALAEISAHPYDVLIADLNVGEPGDGFTIVSAMRRTHPKCVNFILTGYPALDAALQAIRRQVDGFFMKPTSVPQMLRGIEATLHQQDRGLPTAASVRLSHLLRDSVFEITQRSLRAMKAHSELAGMQLSDEDRVVHIPGILSNLADSLESTSSETCVRIVTLAKTQGKVRQAQGYTIPLLIENVHLVESAIAALIHENMLSMDLSNLFSDIARLNRNAMLHTKEMLRGYLEAQERAA